MKYDERMGITHDTIFYGVLHFNFERIHSRFQRDFVVTENDWEYFFALKEVIPEPSSDVYPFFFSDHSKASFLSEYFFYNFEFGKDNLDDFLDKLSENRDEIKKAVFEYYFENEIQESLFNVENAFHLTELIINSNLGDYLTLKLIHLCAEFNKTFNLMLDFLTTVSKEVKKLHHNEHEKRHYIIQSFTAGQICKKLHVVLKDDDVFKTDKNIVSLSYLNPFVMLHKGGEGRNYKFILGYKYEETIETFSSYSQASPKLICEALGNSIKSQILEKLKENEYTATQLSEILYVSRQSINRHLLWLSGNMFVTVSRTNGPEIYYKINHDFFKAAKTILYKHVMDFEEDLSVPIK